ncbi:hypothetical protein CHU95_20420 [Niveispirillum lacus]|uniref:CBM-cenC domain-containing protein n=2 Tax=Niveispirillum lacus TaxID=1981099 RepID=A0A255YQL3_9PROT|nr:hypothetical protein CHU95_20420 [Niveispirillum lacus]
MAFVLLAGSGFALPGDAAADEAALAALQAQLPGKLMNDPTVLDWTVYGQGQKNKRVKTPGIGGGAALQVTSPVASDAAHNIGVNVPLKAGFTPGQAITVAFWARTVSADTPDGKGKLGLRLQLNEAPYSGFGDTMLAIGPEWKMYEAKAQASISVDPGKAVLGFQVAAAKQVVEIGQIFVLDMGMKAMAAAPGGGGGATAIRMPVPERLPGVLLNDPASIDWPVYGAGQTNAKVQTPDIGGGYAMRISSPVANEKPYNIGVSVPLVTAIAADRDITVAFWARTVSADTPDGMGRIGLRMQENAAPYAGFGDGMLSVGPDWKLHQVKMRSSMALDAGKGVLGFQIAGAKQVVEIGQVYVLDLTK